MRNTIALACAVTFAATSFALADSVTIHKTDPEPTNSVVIQEKQDPDIVIKRKKRVVIEEERDPDVTIKSTID